MPKSKKKHKPHRNVSNNPSAIKAPDYYAKTQIARDAIGNLKIIYRPPMGANNIPMNSVSKELAEAINDNNAHKYVTQEKLVVAKFLKDKETDIYSLVNSMCQIYLNKHKGIDQKLNIYNEDNCLKTADIIDFTEYSENNDVLSEAFKIIRNSDDPSLLWATNEYVHIKYNAYTEYIIHRIGYDPDTKETEYEIIGYEDWNLILNNILKIPVVQIRLKVRPNTIGALQAHLDEYRRTHDEKDEDNVILDDAAIQAIKTDYLLKPENEKPFDDISVYTYNVEKISTALDMYKYMQKINNASNTDEKFKSILKQVIKFTCLDIFSDADNPDLPPVNIVSYLWQKISIAIACIIVTNKFILDKKLSRPVNKSNTHSKTQTVVSDNNMPVSRKTRHLGNNIIISSHSKPEAPSVEKIIRYTMAQWNRREHWRHYKSGKVVMVKSTVSHRRCVDIDNNEITDTPGTNYIIHSKKK